MGQHTERANIIRTLAMSAEKKMTQKLATSNPAMLGMDDDAVDLLESIFEFAEKLTSKDEADKLRKDMIKIVVKLALLDKNNRFSDVEKKQLAEIRLQLITIFQTIVTFYETAFTFDADILLDLLNKLHGPVDVIVKAHLTEKTSGRVANVFKFFGNKAYLTTLYNDAAYKGDLQSIAKGLQKYNRHPQKKPQLKQI